MAQSARSGIDIMDRYITIQSRDVFGTHRSHVAGTLQLIQGHSVRMKSMESRSKKVPIPIHGGSFSATVQIEDVNLHHDLEFWM